MIGELQKKSTSLVMNLKSVVKTKESPTKTVVSSQRDAATLQNDDEEDSSSKAVSQKRKQDSFLVEVQERAEVLYTVSS